MAKKTNVPLKRRRRSELNVKLIAIIAAVLFVVTIGIVFAVIGSHKKENILLLPITRIMRLLLNPQQRKKLQPRFRLSKSTL